MYHVLLIDTLPHLSQAGGGVDEGRGRGRQAGVEKGEETVVGM